MTMSLKPEDRERLRDLLMKVLSGSDLNTWDRTYLNERITCDIDRLEYIENRRENKIEWTFEDEYFYHSGVEL